MQYRRGSAAGQRACPALTWNPAACGASTGMAALVDITSATAAVSQSTTSESSGNVRQNYQSCNSAHMSSREWPPLSSTSMSVVGPPAADYAPTAVYVDSCAAMSRSGTSSTRHGCACRGQRYISSAQAHHREQWCVRRDCEKLSLAASSQRLPLGNGSPLSHRWHVSQLVAHRPPESSSASVTT
jgi:hypothetical protein